MRSQTRDNEELQPKKKKKLTMKNTKNKIISKWV